MKISHLLSTVALSAMTLLASNSAFAQAYKLRVMVDPELINPTTTYVEFGPAAIGSTPKATTTFTNQSKTALTVNGATFTASGSAALVSHTCGTKVQPAASCTLTSSLAVAAAGPITGKITIKTGATAGPDTVELTATGVVAAPLLVGTPATLNFGAIPVKAPSVQNLTITNNGNITSKILGLVVGANSSVFSVNSANCQNQFLAPGDSCTVPVTFMPQAASLLTSSISVSIENPLGATKAPIKMTAAALSGSGVTAMPEFVVPAVSPFGTLPQSGAPVSFVMSLQNNGKAAFNIKRLTVEGSSPTVTIADYGTCLEGSELAPGLSCEFTATASVTDFIARTENLYLEYFLSGSNQSTSVKTKTLSVRAGFAQVVAEPYELDFTDAPLNQNTAQSITVTNFGTIAAAIQGITSTPGLLLSSDCAATLEPKASCIVNVTVAPATLDTISESVTITTSSNLNLSNEVLTGPGVQVIPVRGTVKDTRTFDVSASALNFGGVLVGSNLTRSLSVLNVSDAPLTIANVSVSAANGYTVSHNCTEVPAGETCTVSVSFTPASAGNFLNSLTIADSLTTQKTIPLTGSGVAPELNFSGPTLDFGNVAVNTTATRSLTVSNTGTHGSTLSWTFPAGYSAAGGTCGLELEQNSSCTLVVEFAPTEDIVYSGALGLTGSAGTSKSVSLTGKGLIPVPIQSLGFTVSPTSLDFQTVPVGTSVVKEATISNTGGGPLHNFSAATLGSAYSGSATCPNPLPMGASCPVSVTFMPTDSEAYPGSLSLSFDAVMSQVVALSGYGGVPSLQFENTSAVVVTSASFGPTSVGATSSSQVFVLRNTGAAPLIFSNPALSTTSGFTLEANSCASKVLAPSDTCSVTVSFTPTAAQVYSGKLQSLSNQTNAPFLTLAGQTGAPAIQYENTGGTPISGLTYGVVQVGTASASQTVVVRNTGNTPLVLAANSATASSVFTVGANTCNSATLNPSQTCSIALVMNPAAAQAYTGSLTLASNAPAPSFSLQGNGGAPALQFVNVSGNPVASMSFAAVAGSASPAQRVFIKNTGTLNAVFNPSAATAANPFTISSNACNNAQLAPGQTCAVDVVFSPAAVQSFNSTLVPQAAVASAPSLALSGVSTAALTYTATTELTCPASVYVGSTASCTGKITSTGNAAVNVTSPGLSATQGAAKPSVSAASISCTGGATLANLLAGQSCSFTVSVVMGNASDYILTLAPVASNATVPASTATMTVTQPSLSLTTQNHPATQVGSPSTVTHTLKNTGAGSVTVNTVSSSDAGISAVLTGCSTLAPGATCTVTSTCKAVAAGTSNAVLTVNATPVVTATGSTSCTASIAALTSSYEPNQSADVGAFTKSGNWVRITNNGVGAITLKTFTPSTGWTLGPVGTGTTMCTVNKVLGAGASCLILEALTGAQGLNQVVSGAQNIITSAAPLSWVSSTLSTKGLLVAPAPGFVGVENSKVNAGVFSITNQAPVATGPLSYAVSGLGMAVGTNTCGASLASGATCQVTVNYTAGSAPITVNEKLIVKGAYPAVISKVTQSGLSTVNELGSAAMQFTIASNTTATPSTNTLDFGAVAMGSSLSKTFTVVNSGNQSLTTPVVTGTGGPYTFVHNCATLAPAASCVVNVTYRPTAYVTQSGTATVKFQNFSAIAVALTGRGTGAQVAYESAPGAEITTLAMGSVEFPGSLTKTVYVTNKGDIPLTFSTPGVAVTSGYTISANTCAGASVAAGTRCSVTLTFTPANAGDYSGATSTMSVSTNGTNVSPLLLTAQSLARDAVDLVLTDNHSFFQTASGEWMGTGKNMYGALGFGGTSEVFKWTPLPHLSGATKVVASDRAAFARMSDGTWRVAGTNTYKQMGLTGTGLTATFTRVPALDGALEVVPGNYFTFAKLADNSWVAVGQNTTGELGLGNRATVDTFTAVPAIAGAQKVVVGGSNAFAQMSSRNWVVSNKGVGPVAGSPTKTAATDYKFSSATWFNKAIQVVASDTFTYAEMNPGEWWVGGTSRYGLTFYPHEDNLGVPGIPVLRPWSGLNNATKVVTSGATTFAYFPNSGPKGNWQSIGLNYSGQIGQFSPTMFAWAPAYGGSRICTKMQVVSKLAGASMVYASKNTAMARHPDGRWVSAGLITYGEAFLSGTREAFTSDISGFCTDAGVPWPKIWTEPPVVGSAPVQPPPTDYNIRYQ